MTVCMTCLIHDDEIETIISFIIITHPFVIRTGKTNLRLGCP